MFTVKIFPSDHQIENNPDFAAAVPVFTLPLASPSAARAQISETFRTNQLQLLDSLENAHRHAPHLTLAGINRQLHHDGHSDLAFGDDLADSELHLNLAPHLVWSPAFSSLTTLTNLTDHFVVMIAAILKFCASSDCYRIVTFTERNEDYFQSLEVTVADQLLAVCHFGVLSRSIDSPLQSIILHGAPLTPLADPFSPPHS